MVGEDRSVDAFAFRAVGLVGGDPQIGWPKVRRRRYLRPCFVMAAMSHQHSSRSQGPARVLGFLGGLNAADAGAPSVRALDPA